MPVMPAVASFCHSGRSNTDQLSFSSCWRCSCVAASTRISRARARNDFWSSVSEKSMSSLSQRSGHLEAEDGDEVSLDLVGAATEGEDQRAAIGPFDPAGQDRPGRGALEDAGGTEDFEQQAVALAVGRRAVDLDAG